MARMPSNMNAATGSLLFHWQPPRQRRLAITLFLVGSIMAHLLCFYLFQVVYPQPVALLPRPARVSLIAAQTEEGRALLQWIEAEDPALAFIPQRPPEAKLRALPTTVHVPSYLTREPILRTAPPLVVDLRAASPMPPGAVPVTRRADNPMTRAIPTTVSFSDELTSLGPPSFGEFKFAASTKEAPQNVRFRVAVGEAGEMRYAFPLNSSGDPALDAQARNYLMRCRFPGRRSSSVWGTANIEWGNDLARAGAISTLSPAPLTK